MNFCEVTLQDLAFWLKEHGEKEFHARQIFEWVYQKRVLDFDKMSNLNKELRQKLSKAFHLPTLELVQTLESKDQETVKFLWKLSDGNLVESVLIYSGKAYRLRFFPSRLSG